MARKAKLGRLCEDGRICGGDGIAEAVDHILPFTDYPDQDAYDFEGLQAICPLCHQAKTAEETAASVARVRPRR
jgi:5-methylcytosine-specific restriction endonuclease McrA